MGFLDKMKEQAKQKYAELQKQFSGEHPQQMHGEPNQQMYGGKPQQVHENQQQYQSQSTPNSTTSQNVPSSFQPIAEQSTGQPLPPQPVEQSQATSQQNGAEGGIYGGYMEHLIEMALADGELTEKEKQVLFKKATAMGIDLDEFEMVLDARLYERQKNMKAEQPIAQEAAPSSDKYGDVRKCPACGAIVESFTIKCADCGYEFRNVTTTVSSVQILHKKIHALEESRKYGLSDGIGFTNKVDRQIAALIQMFPVPVTKEDIFEFLALSASLAKKPSLMDRCNSMHSANQNMVANAWYQKCFQVVIKARLAMKDDKKSLEQIEDYAKMIGIKTRWNP